MEPTFGADPSEDHAVEHPSFPGLGDIRRLQSGGMGTVFRARQLDLDRAVAVKTLRLELQANAEQRRLFVREAHTLARLDHPNIVPVHYAGETADGPYYVMRLVEGESIDLHLANASAEEIAQAFRSIAEALATAHREGVLHRDVKPANVLMDAAGKPILVDFGLSMWQRLGDEEGTMDLEAEARIVGTPDYLAPEILGGEGYSHVSDVYALGATLYRILTGRVPFPAADLDAKLLAIREEDPAPPRAIRSAVPKPLQAICLKAMDRAPADRYPTAEAMREDLDRFLRGDPVTALPVRSQTLLRRKLEHHIEDHAEWERLGLLDEGQRAALHRAYQQVDEVERGILRGVLSSLPDLLLLAGILLIVFGPVLLLLIAWSELGAAGRVALPGLPLVLLSAVGVQQWRVASRRRATACLFGAALLSAPLFFALADLVPALHSIADDEGTPQLLVPGELWLPGADEPDWRHAAAFRLRAKVLFTALLTLVVAAELFRRTRSAMFLWVLCFAAYVAVLPTALLTGWMTLDGGPRWLFAVLGSSGALVVGILFDRGWRSDRALPFYGLGFVGLLATALTYHERGLPLSLVGIPESEARTAWAAIVHGVGFLALGIGAHVRGTPLLRQSAGVSLLAGFFFVVFALGALATDTSPLYEVPLVASCLAFLLLGLALHRNALVLPSAIALPITIGVVSQRHIGALWAWSAAVVIGGAAMVLLSLRVSARRDSESPTPIPK